MSARLSLASLARSLYLAALVGVALLARGAQAADPREAARAHYARGLALAAQNGYEAALREFTEAYATSPQFAVLFNIGQAEVALGHPLEAIAALSKYLHDGRDRLPPGRRDQVQAQIASLVAALDASPAQGTSARSVAASDGGQPIEPPRSAVGSEPLRPVEGGHLLQPAVEGEPRAVSRSTTLAVRCAEPGVKIALDGKPVDVPTASRGLPVAPGPHRLALSSAGRRPAEQTVEVASGSASVVLCQFLSPLPPGAEPRVSFDGPPVFSPALSPPARAVEVHPSSVGVALGALGVALEGGALGIYLWNRGQVSTANAERASLATESPTADGHYDRVVSYNERADSIHRASVFTVGLAVAGGAALAGGFYLWRRGRTNADTAEPAHAPEGGLTVHAAAGFASLSWSGSW